MRYQRTPNRDSYDVVVIGAGMGGLSAAAELASRGLSVLNVEAHYQPGGFAHAFHRGGPKRRFTFDSAVHLSPGGGPGEGLHKLLSDWGVDHLVEFLPVQPMYRTIGPGLETEIYSGQEAFIESHIRYFPHEAEGIRSFVETMARIAHEIQVLSSMEIPKSEMMRTMIRYCPTVLKHSSRSLLEMLSQHVDDPVCRSVLSTLWTYLGLPPSSCSGVAFSVMMMSFINENAYYVRGSFQKLADAFVAALKKFGGELVFPRRVERILLDERGHACGIELDKDGERIHARRVISNSDAYQTFMNMVGPEHLTEDFAQSIASRPLSISAFEVFLGVEADLKAQGVLHETFFAPGHDPQEVYDNHARAEIFGCGLSVPTIEDDTVAPAGHHIVCATMFAPWDRPWNDKEYKWRIAEGLIDEAEKVIPGLRENIVYKDAGTPFTMHRYSGNRNGAIYGWDSSPKSLATRLAMETPIPGLYLAGHWTRPGGGLFAVVTSGQIAADRVYDDLCGKLSKGKEKCA